MNKIKIATAAILLTALLATATFAQEAQSKTSPKALAIQAQVESMMLDRQHLREMIKVSEAELVELSSQRSESIEKQDAIGVSPESFPEIMKTLQSQRIQLTIDLAGLEARRNMLAEAREESKMEKNNELLVPLMKILEIENMNLDHVEKLHATGSTSKSEVLSARRKILTVEVQIAEAKSRQSSSTYASRINSNLLDTALEHADRQARLDTTLVLLSTLTESRVLVEKSTSNEQKISLLRKMMTEAANNIRQVEGKIDQLHMELERLQ